MADAVTPLKKSTSRWHTTKNVERMAFIILIAPAIAMVTIFIVFPVVTSVVYSIFDWNGLGPLEEKDVVGLENFKSGAIELTMATDGGQVGYRLPDTAPAGPLPVTTGEVVSVADWSLY